MTLSYREQGAPAVHVALVDTAVVVVVAGSVMVLGAWEVVIECVETIVTVTVDGGIVGFDAEVARELVVEIEVLVV
jgi:hypothetical protein